MSKKKNVALASTFLASTVLIAGCGLFGNGSQEIDPPQQETYVEDESELKEGENVKTEETTSENSVMTELYCPLIRKLMSILKMVKQL